MAVTERSRHKVHKHFEETMGEELAATLMELLPGVGWVDVARRRDIDELRVATAKDIDALRDWASVRFESIDKRFDSVDKRLDSIEKALPTRADMRNSGLVVSASTTAFLGVVAFLLDVIR